MTSYEKIFSRSRLKMDDLKEIMSLSDNDLTQINTERLHSVVGDVRVQYLFSNFSMDDEIQEITYELKNKNNDFFDEEFVVELFALGMVITWLRPKVDSVLHTAAFIGGKEEKKIKDDHKLEIERLAQLENKQYKMLRDRGYMYNNYLQGE